MIFDKIDWRIVVALLLLAAWYRPRLLRVVAAISFLYPIAAVTLRYFSFEVNAFDISIFDQMLRDGRMISELCQCHHFSIHPQFLLIPLSWLYRWIATPVFLQLTHAVAYLIFAWLIFDDQRSRSPWFRCVILACVVFQHFGLSMLHYGFHPEVLFLPLGWIFIRSHERDSSRWVWWIFFLLVKEDAGLYAATYLLLSPRRGSRIQAFISLAFVAVMLIWIKPAYGVSDQDYFVRFWGDFGQSPSAIITTMLTEPWRVAERVVLAKGFWRCLVYTGCAFVFIELRFLAPILLGLGIHLSAHPTSALSSLGLYYAAPILPFFWFGILRRFDAWSPVYQGLVMICMLTLGTAARLPVPDLSALRRVHRLDQPGRHYVVQSSLYPHFRRANVELWTSTEQCTTRTPVVADPDTSAFPLQRPTCGSINIRTDSPRQENR